MPCTTAHSTIRIALPAEPASSAADWPFLRWLDRLLRLPAHGVRLYRRHKGRQQLLELDDRLLNDIGLTREQADIIAKSFWV